jgi:hypothetical protein
MDILDIYKKINDFTGKIDTNEEYIKDDSCNLFGLDVSYGTGIYLTEKGIIKRYSIAQKDNNNRKTGEYILYDKKICPIVLYPCRSIFVNNKYEMELTDGNIKRMLTDEALINLREFKKYLQQFSREFWFDGDNDDVTKIHKLIIQMKKELNIKTEKVNNQFGWIDNKFSPYDIPVFIDDPVLKELEDSFNVVGDMEKWLEKINKYRENPIFETQFLTSLAGPILQKLNLMPVWVHLVGKSSMCKTAAMIAIASMYGCPIDDGRNLIASFNTTVVGLENRLHILNNIPYFANDSQNLSSYIRAEDLIYLAFEGKGRNRGQRSEQSRVVKRWLTTAITNGEKPLLGKSSYEGAVKRCIQIFGRSMELDEGKKVRRFFYQNYGHVGRKWIEILKELDIKKTYKIQDYIYDELKESNYIDDNIQQVTTMCLCQYLFETNINGLLKEIAIKRAVETGFKILGLIEVNKDSADMCNKIVNYLKDFVAQNMSRFRENDQLNHERYGFLKDGNVVFFNNKLDDLLTKEFNYDPKLFRKEIKERNLVVLDEKGYFKQVKYDKSNARYPQFKAEIIFGIDEEENKIIKLEREGIKHG